MEELNRGTSTQPPEPAVGRKARRAAAARLRADLENRFEHQRERLGRFAHAVAPNADAAEMALQETLAELRRSGGSAAPDDLGRWLVATLARVAYTQSCGDNPAEPGSADAAAARIALVLHDVYDLTFDAIAPLIDRAPAAARQLAVEARRAADAADMRTADAGHRHVVITAFLAASHEPDATALWHMLDPGVVLCADAATVAMGCAPEVRGPAAVAETFRGRAQVARLALIDGVPGLVWAPGGSPRVVFEFGFHFGMIAAIHLTADAEQLRVMDIRLLRTS